MIPNFDDAKIRILFRIPIHYEKNYKYLDGIKIENKLPTSTITFLPDLPETFLINIHHRLSVYSQPNYKSYFQINLPSSPIIPYYPLLSPIIAYYCLLLLIIAYYCLLLLITPSVITSQLITAYQPSHHRPSQHITAHHTLPLSASIPPKRKKESPGDKSPGLSRV